MGTPAQDLQVIESQVYGLRDSWSAALTDANLRFEAEAGFAVQALMGGDYIRGIALRQPQSVINAVTNVAAIGITLNPAKKQAYLIPRKINGTHVICLDISYMGLIELAVASGSIRWAQAKLVHERDSYTPAGYDKPPEHVYQAFGSDRGTVVGVYVVAKTSDGDFLTHEMDIASVNNIRDRSDSWIAYVTDKKRSPWATDTGEMIKKTVIKQASKTWPKTPRLLQGIYHLNTDAGEGLAEISGPASATSYRDEWVSKVGGASTEDDLRAVSRAGSKEFQAKRDREGYAAFVAAVQKRGAALKAPALPAPSINPVSVAMGAARKVPAHA